MPPLGYVLGKIDFSDYGCRSRTASAGRAPVPG